MRLGPLASHQLPVPPKEGLRPDQERTPGISPKQPARRCEERPVRCTVDGPFHLPAEDDELVSQHHVLKLHLSRHALVGP